LAKGVRQKVTSNANHTTTIISQHNVFTWNKIQTSTQTYINGNLMLMLTDIFFKEEGEGGERKYGQ
jgi:hypothetical protein